MTPSGAALRPGLRQFFQAVAEHDPWTVLAYLHVPLVEWEGDTLSVLEASRRGVDPSLLRAVGERLARDLAR